ncbi:uncharacterized protein RAG0_10427 [Rhynchosporium agropyri]|uniref:F-box domain-containing protein n=2 Tax=Rhynchosporium TaxID=38037 RepID=A0A1E1KZT5_9HELO|nr:uncharacterized protein RAG0_10427 [Rhynchosporium agropyri]
MSFLLFASFPAEIQGMILEACPPNDQICLRLTCKALYYTRPATHSAPVSLETTELSIEAYCGKLTAHLDWSDRWSHRRECHDLTYEATCVAAKNLGMTTPGMKKKCRMTQASHHCECFSRTVKLHRRLKSWMPQDLKYCGSCEKFTKRKRSHKGRCYHGIPKQRQSKRNYWSHTSRNGAFGRKIWKKWFNNRAMNQLEARLASERQAVARHGSQRYSLRTLKPMDIDTIEVRDSRSDFIRSCLAEYKHECAGKIREFRVMNMTQSYALNIAEQR